MKQKKISNNGTKKDRTFIAEPRVAKTVKNHLQTYTEIMSIFKKTQFINKPLMLYEYIFLVLF